MNTRELLIFLSKLIKPYKYRFLFASFLRFITDLTNLFPAFALASIVNRLSNHDYSIAIWYFIIGWIFVMLIQNFGRGVAKYHGYLVAEHMALDAHIMTVRHLFRLDIAWHEKENSGSKMKRILNGADGINKIMHLWINSLIEVFVNFTGVVIVLFFYSRGTAFASIFFVITFFILSYKLISKAAKMSTVVHENEERLSGLSFEAINNIRSVKVLNLSHSLERRINSFATDVIEKIKKRIYRYRVYGVISEQYANIFRFSAIIYIIYGVIHGKFEVGFLVMFWAYFSRIWESSRELADGTRELTDSKYAIARMSQILNEPIKIDDESNKIDFDPRWKTLRVLGVSFSYGSHEVLKDVSFELKRGEKLGIVGLSGAGKSTLLKLLMKENEEYKGEILFDEFSIQEFKKSSFFRYSSVVLQDTEVFNFSLRENITISDPDGLIDTDRLNRSMEIAHVDDFLHDLPQGIDTLIGEKGVKLSGGERQRLGIARAVYKRPEILFLDEATSHLDLESEEKIQDSLHKFFKSVTAIVIAHRLTTIKEMDRILVMENGRIIETGSFNELYKRKGRFRELWDKQRL